MADLYRFRAVLNGFTGAPGLNTFYFRSESVVSAGDLNDTAALIKAVYADLATDLVPGLTMDVESEVAVLNDANGVIHDAKVITPPSQFMAVAGGNIMSRSTMLVARFKTDLFVNGRRLQGKHFLGPCSSAAIASNGDVAGSTITSVNGAYDGLLDILGLRLAVWHRPTAPGLADGSSGHVQQVSCMPKPGILSSRRD